jgi:hypothetical protein
LKLDHQLNQLVLAQALQISPFHEHMDSEIALRGKGVGKYKAQPLMAITVVTPLNRIAPFAAKTKYAGVSSQPSLYVRERLPLIRIVGGDAKQFERIVELVDERDL